jgi:hypothetical protein
MQFLWKSKTCPSHPNTEIEIEQIDDMDNIDNIDNTDDMVDEFETNDGIESLEIEEFQEEDIFRHPIASQVWKNDTHERFVHYYFMSIRDVAPHLMTWCFNRKLDKEHKDNIKKDLLSQTHPHLMGTIQVVRDKQKKCKVVNGQHRLKAIQEIIQDDLNMTFHMNVMFEVYDLPVQNIDDIEENMEDIEMIFKTANKSLNFVPEDDHDLFCRKIVTQMASDPLLKKGIVDRSIGNVNRPKILMKDLYEDLKTYLPSDLGTSIEDILIAIKKINVDLSMKTIKDMYGRVQPAIRKMRQHEKAKQMGFYLNLDGRFPPSVWIPMLLKNRRLN